MMKPDNGSVKRRGLEFGATTGRPRRCGWLDLLVVKHATMMNGLTDLVLTKIDVLSGLDTLYVCTGYEIDGKVYDYIPSDQAMVAKAKPIYKEFAQVAKKMFPKWKTLTNSLKTVRHIFALSKNSRAFVCQWFL